MGELEDGLLYASGSIGRPLATEYNAPCCTSETGKLISTIEGQSDGLGTKRFLKTDWLANGRYLVLRRWRSSPIRALIRAQAFLFALVVSGSRIVCICSLSF